MGDVIYKKLDKFLSDSCEFSTQFCTKGSVLHVEFGSFLNKNKVPGSLNIRHFYDLLRKWIINQKDPQMQIKEHSFSKIIYFIGVQIKGKIDNSKAEYDKYRREKVKISRHEKAEEEGRIIRERKVGPRLQKIYITQLPEDVSTWNQNMITIENFEPWYNQFIKNLKDKDPEELILILNTALNNFRHAKGLKPRKFNNNNFESLIHHIESTLLFLDEKSEGIKENSNKNDSEKSEESEDKFLE